MIPLGDYLPDAPATGQHATIAKNCVPDLGFYAPFKSQAAHTSAAAEAVIGAKGFLSTTGTEYNFIGTTSYLYRSVGGAPVDLSKSGGYNTPASGRWEFANFSGRVIAVNGEAKPQSFVMGTSTAFADLTSDDVIAKTVAIVRGFVFLGNMIEAGVYYKNRVRWSALEDPTDFTAAVATQSDYQDLYGEQEIGEVQVVVGGENATIFCEKAIFLATYIGGEIIFQFDQISNNLGTPAPQSVAAHGNTIFFLGNNGFYALAGGMLMPIGEGKVDNTFFAEVYTAEIDTVTGTIDPARNLYIVALPTSTGVLSKLYIYNWLSKRWTTCEPGNLENVTSFYIDGVETLMGTNTSHEVEAFTGSALTATFETAEQQFVEGRKSLVTKTVPIVEGSGSTVTVQVGYRNTPQETVSYTTAATMGSEGEAYMFNVARYQRFKLSVSGGFTKAYGITPTVRPQGLY